MFVQNVTPRLWIQREHRKYYNDPTEMIPRLKLSSLTSLHQSMQHLIGCDNPISPLSFAQRLQNFPTLSFLFHQVAFRGIEQSTRPTNQFY